MKQLSPFAKLYLVLCALLSVSFLFGRIFDFLESYYFFGIGVWQFAAIVVFGIYVFGSVLFFLIMLIRALMGKERWILVFLGCLFASFVWLIDLAPMPSGLDGMKWRAEQQLDREELLKLHLFAKKLVHNQSSWGEKRTVRNPHLFAKHLSEQYPQAFSMSNSEPEAYFREEDDVLIIHYGGSFSGRWGLQVSPTGDCGVPHVMWCKPVYGGVWVFRAD